MSSISVIRSTEYIKSVIIPVAHVTEINDIPTERGLFTIQIKIGGADAGSFRVEGGTSIQGSGANFYALPSTVTIGEVTQTAPNIVYYNDNPGSTYTFKFSFSTIPANSHKLQVIVAGLGNPPVGDVTITTTAWHC